MCLNLYYYQSKASRYSYGLKYLKTRVTTNQKHTVDSPKPKRKKLKYNTKENHQTIKAKLKRRNEQIRTTKNKEKKVEIKQHATEKPMGH